MLLGWGVGVGSITELLFPCPCGCFCGLQRGWEVFMDSRHSRSGQEARFDLRATNVLLPFVIVLSTWLGKTFQSSHLGLQARNAHHLEALESGIYRWKVWVCSLCRLATPLVGTVPPPPC